MYALTTAFPHSHRLRNEKSQRKITLAYSEPIPTAIKKRRLRLLGHVLRISPNRITRVALRRTPQGKRKQGILKAIWLRILEKEIKAIGLTWDEAEMYLLWTELVGGREWRPHAPRRAKSKKKKKRLSEK